MKWRTTITKRVTCDNEKPKRKWQVHHIENGELQHITYHDTKASAEAAAAKWRNV